MGAFCRVVATGTVHVAHGCHGVFLLVKGPKQLRSIKRVGCPHFTSPSFRLAIDTISAVTRSTVILTGRLWECDLADKQGEEHRTCLSQMTPSFSLFDAETTEGRFSRTAEGKLTLWFGTEQRKDTALSSKVNQKVFATVENIGRHAKSIPSSGLFNHFGTVNCTRSFSNRHPANNVLQKLH